MNESERANATVVIPCFNAAPFIRAAIESCLRQTIQAAEVVVVDDASTDGSSSIIDTFAATGEIRLIRNSQRRGKSASLNTLFDTITTQYIILMDADDESKPDRVARQVKFMDDHLSVGCSSTFVEYINREGRTIARGSLDLLTAADLARYVAGQEPFGLFGPAVILRTKAVRDPALRFRDECWLAEDIDLWNRIAEAGWDVLAQPEFLVRYRIHSDSAITSKAREARLQFEWVRACLRARRNGSPEPSREQFHATLAAQPWHTRVNRLRKIEAKAASRAAGFAYAEGRLLKACLTGAKAFLLQPAYMIKRVANRLCGI